MVRNNAILCFIIFIAPFINSSVRGTSIATNCSEIGLCYETEGKVGCSCSDGATTAEDGVSCAGVNNNWALILVCRRTSDESFTERVAFLYESNFYYAYNVSIAAIIRESVTYDQHNFYWLTREAQEVTAYRSKSRLGVNSVKVLGSSETVRPSDLAADWITGNLYYTDNVQDTINVCADNLIMVCSVVLQNSNLSWPSPNLGLNPNLGVMFWIGVDAYNHSLIYRADMDGGRMRSVVGYEQDQTEDFTISFLAIDQNDKRIYWSYAELAGIWSADYNGGCREVMRTPHEPTFLEIVGPYVFWNHVETPLSLIWFQNKYGVGKGLAYEQRGNRFTFQPLTLFSQSRLPIRRINPCVHKNGGSKCEKVCALTLPKSLHGFRCLGDDEEEEYMNRISSSLSTCQRLPYSSLVIVSITFIITMLKL